MKTGRYLITPDGEPYYNMALDEWLFEQLSDNSFNCDAILRLYSWKTNAITIGCNQDVSKVVDFDLLDNSIPVIKRITGGRAIFHDRSELTFSLIIGLDLIPDRLLSLSATNRLISETLVEIFRAAGIDSIWEKQSNEKPLKSNRRRDKISCFDSVSRYELSSGLAKIAGGAQRRRGDYMIHQGSLKLNGVAPCPAIGQEERPVLPGVEDGKRQYYSIERLSDIFGMKFSDNLKVDFKTSKLTSSENKKFDIFYKNQRENSLKKTGFI